MCKRRNPDPLVRIFLERYRMNLLAMPGNRVKCGSVYVKRGRHLMAPGDLSDLVEPELHLPPAYQEPNLPELRGSWSSQISVNLGIGLLKNFLVAIGAGGLIDDVKAGVERHSARSVSFNFNEAERESLSPTSLGVALEDRRFRAGNPWVRPGNSYFVAAAVIRSPSISIRAHDDHETAVDLKASIASVVDAETGVSVAHGEDHEVIYKGKQPLGFAVELYELAWDDERGTLVFDMPRGPQPVTGFDAGDLPESVFVGEDDEAIVVVSD